MGQVNANIDDEVVKQFRHVIYTRKGLKKGDFKDALEEAMLDYIQKFGESETARRMAEKAKVRKNVDEND